MESKRILFGICGSFCNHEFILDELKRLSVHNYVQIIVSDNVYRMDTRFHKAEDFLNELRKISKHEIWHTLEEAEKVGPIYKFDIMVIAPMTSTVLSKLKNGIYDNPISLAAKAHLRNEGKVVIGVSSNDILSISGSNLFTLLNYKNIYSIPFYQDNPYTKPNSIVSEWSLIEDTIEFALKGKQIQPLLIERSIQ